jgi:subtilase-type serine protease
MVLIFSPNPADADPVTSACPAAAGARKFAALITLCGLLCAPGASRAGEGSDWSLFDRYTASYTIPYTAPVAFDEPRPAMRAMVQIDGSAPFSMQIDTGSQGIVVSKSFVPNFRRTGRKGKIHYSSDGNIYDGFWQRHTVRLPDSFDSEGRTGVVEATVRIFVATRLCPLSGPCIDDPPVSMMGIGFGRPDDGYVGYQPSLIDNPVLNLPEMISGRMRAGYVMSKTALQVGLTAANAGSNFAWAKLFPLDTEASANWTPMQGTMLIDGVSQGRGLALLDSGLPNMIAQAPTLQNNCPVQPDPPETWCNAAKGTRIDLSLLGTEDVAGLSFAASAKNQRVGVPFNPQWHDWNAGASVINFNTGVQGFADFTVAVDAVDGWAGLKQAGNSAQAYLNPTLILSQRLKFPHGLRTTLPVVVNAPTTITSRRKVAFDADLSGAGPLSVAAHPFVFSGKGSLPAGLTVRHGTFVLTGTLRADLTVLPGAAFINRGRLIGRVTQQRH